MNKKQSIPASLIQRFKKEVPIANKILKERKKRNTIANDVGGIKLRVSDLSKFKDAKSARRYIKQIHQIVTGEYFQQRLRNYRQNLIKSFLRNKGIDAEHSITFANVNQYINLLNKDDYDMLVYLANVDRATIERLAEGDFENLIRYQYGAEQYQGEHLERLQEVFNQKSGKGGVAKDEGAYDAYIKYRRLRGS